MIRWAAFAGGLAVAALTVILLGTACGDGEQGSEDGITATPTTTPTTPPPLPQSPTPNVTALPPELSAQILPLMPLPEDVPPALGQLGPPQTFTPEDLFSVTQLAAPSPEEMLSWKFLGGGSSSYINPELASEDAPELVAVTVYLHLDEDGSREFFDFSRTYPSESFLRGIEGQAGRVLDQYAEFTEPAVGEETRIITFSSHVREQESLQYQGYYVYGRRGRVVFVSFGRALRGLISLDDLVELARNIDARITAADL